MREPNFNNLLNVLRRETPERPTLFEFFMNPRLYGKVAPEAAAAAANTDDPKAQLRLLVAAFAAMGYDYTTVMTWLMRGLSFPAGKVAQESSRSMNEGFVITDRASFERYAWQDPDRGNYDMLEWAGNEIPDGMKLVVAGPGGVLENVTALLGYQNLCFMIADDPDLAQDVFDAVGSRLLRYYERCLEYDSVGAIISNDDWGFKTQTMLAPNDMRRFVFPWHRRIVAAAHRQNRPAILHSCGKFDDIVDDIVEDMKFDGRHSYEDAILPVEDAYEKYGGRIAILGGIDVDFVCRATPEQVYRRSRAMLERAETRGGYALGTGNSVPEYVPDANFLALVRAATEA